MNQEIKDRLEQAAAAKYTLVTEQNYWIAGAQTILENPGQWGLIDEMLFRGLSNSCESWVNKWAKKNEECRMLQSQLTKYKQALERIVSESTENERDYDAVLAVEGCRVIAEEALRGGKQ